MNRPLLTQWEERLPTENWIALTLA